jgi:hypothetical protein
MPKANRKSVSTGGKRGIARKTSRSPVSTSKLVGKNLERAVEQFQSEPNDKKAHEQWKQIEASVFGVQFED